MLNIMEYNTQKKNIDNVKVDNNKLKPKKTGLPKKADPVNKDKPINNVKRLSAFDFETLTENEKTQAICLGYATIDAQSEKVTSKVIHNEKGLSYNNNLEYKHSKHNQAVKWKDMQTDDERQEILRQCVSILTDRKFQSTESINFFYNSKYDFGMLVSKMNEEQLEMLSYTGECIVTDGEKNYTLKDIGGKCFVFQYKYTTSNDKEVTQTWMYYDLLQFTMTSLDEASKDWLGEDIGGKTEGFDTKTITNNRNLLEENYQDTLKYCMNDVEITVRLAKMAKDQFEEMGIPFTTPISPASLFKKYLAYNEEVFNADCSVEEMQKLSKEERKKNKYYYSYPSYNGYNITEKAREKLESENPEKLKGMDNRADRISRMQGLAWNGYYGGLFEMYKRGYFPHAVGFDYASMYPSIMRILPHLQDCKIHELNMIRDQHELTTFIHDADWAVLKVRVWTEQEGKIQLFSCDATIQDENGKETQKIIRPSMNGQEVIISKQTFEFFIHEYPHYINHEIVEGFTVREMPVIQDNKQSRARKPFLFLNDLFQNRQDIIAEHGKEDKRQLVLKIILNGGYGTQAETIPKNMNQLKHDGEIELHHDELTAGQVFRPFYAFHITDLARLQIYKDIFRNDLEQDIIGVATDCLFLQGDGLDKIKKSPNLNQTDEKVLGMLEVEKEGQMIVLGNGMYEVLTSKNSKKWKDLQKEMDKEKREKERQKLWDSLEGENMEQKEIDLNTDKTTRGFRDDKFPNMFLSQHNAKSQFPIQAERPTTWREELFRIIRTQRDETDTRNINHFFLETKTCNINMDTSRQWERNFHDLEDVKQGICESKPLVLPKE